jgi:hypothetical protein
MANLITHNLSFSKESVTEYFLKPLFIDNDIRDLIDVRTDIKSGEKLDFVDKLQKITKAWAKGTAFTRANGITITQKTLTMADLKAEVGQNGHAFLNYVKQAALKKGVDENDISGTIFEEILSDLFMRGLAADFRRQVFFNQANKETMSSDVPTGTTDADYNQYQGFWDRVLAGVGSGDITSDQVVDLNSSTYQTTVAVSGIDTVTLTGSSGTGNITVNGVAYLATFATDLTTTAANFVTAHAATIVARMNGIVVTSSGADVIFTASIPGALQSVSNNVNASGNLAGNVVATTPEVQNTTLKADAALTAFKASISARPATMRAIEKGMLRILATSSLVDNYQDSRENSSSSDSAWVTMRDGEARLAYRGIPIVEMASWDEHIDADFGGVRPHRFMLVYPKNLIFGTDGESDMLNVEMFYDQVEQDNVLRAEYKGGTQYIHPDYIVLGY